MTEDDYLMHHGVKGQKWGLRQYQNEDGSLTDLGREHYGYGEARSKMLSAKADYKAAQKAYGKAYNKATGVGQYIRNLTKKGRAENDKRYTDLYNTAQNAEKARKAYKEAKKEYKSDVKAAKKEFKEADKELNKALNTAAKAPLIGFTQKQRDKIKAANKYVLDAAEKYNAAADKLKYVKNGTKIASKLLDSHPEDHGINPNSKRDRIRREEYEDAYGKTTGSISKQIKYQQKYGPNI